MPKREQLIRELEGDNDVGVLFVAQMGKVPDEIQLIIQTAQYDADADDLRDRTTYLVRGFGVVEHRVTLGAFGSLFFAIQHPILYHHNAAQHEIRFEGIPADPNALLLDIQAAYSTTFGPWRSLTNDINTELPLFDLLKQGQGTLGELPLPIADLIMDVFEHHDLVATSIEISLERSDEPDDDGHTERLKLLSLDDSYLVAHEFRVEEIAAYQKP